MKKYFTFYRIALVALFLFGLIFLIIAAKSNSQTTDEGVHLFAGYTYLTQHDYRLDPEHPPLLKELAAFPEVFLKPKVSFGELWQQAGPFYYDSWQQARILSDKFLYGLGNNVKALLFWGRLPFVLLTLLLAFAIYYWANKIYGRKAGLFAAFLAILFPNFLAHGILINTDLGATLFIFLTVYFWGKYLKKPGWLELILFGLFAGLAFSSKFTTLLVLPILILLLVGKLLYDKKATLWWRYLLGLVGGLAVGFLVILISYGFLINIPPATNGSVALNLRNWTGYQIPYAADIVFQKARLAMFPADFYKGIFLVLRHGLGGHGSFLLGQTSGTGWWYYFPVAIFYKTPIALFLFLILAFAYRKKTKAKIAFDDFLLIITPLVYLALSINSKADLGIRHVLPIFPFLIVLASRSINIVTRWGTSAIVFGILIVWYAVSSLWSYPNSLSYFNEFAGGPNGGYKILRDSNLDWGQNIYRIKEYIDQYPGVYYIHYPWDSDEALKYFDLNATMIGVNDRPTNGKVIITVNSIGFFPWLENYPSKQIIPGVFEYSLN